MTVFLKSSGDLSTKVVIMNRQPGIFGMTDKKMLIKSQKGHLIPSMLLARAS